MGGLARAGRPEQVPVRVEGQAPVIDPRIIIKPERHPPGGHVDAPVGLGVVRGGRPRHGSVIKRYL